MRLFFRKKKLKPTKFYDLMLDESNPETAKKLIKWQKICDKLISSDDYKFVVNFVKAHKHLFEPKSIVYVTGTFDFSQKEYDDFLILKDLLNKKGHNLNEKVLDALLSYEAEKQIYNEFEKKISFNDPKNIDEYIINLIEVYGENCLNYLHFIFLLSKSKKYKLTENQILKKMEKLKKQIDIIEFEKRFESEKIEQISMKDIDSMSGYDFERFLKKLFEKMGYKVEHTKFSSDQGGDLVVLKFGDKTVVQAKRYGGKVSNKSVQEVVASIKHYKANDGMVVTNNEFTKSAIQLAKSNKIELIDRNELNKLIKNYF